MGNVVRMTVRKRRDNPGNPLGRVYLTLRDASYWMDLDEIQDAIEQRFGEEDSIPMILARIGELSELGEHIEARMSLGVGVNHREYRMGGEPQGAA